jgi:hypothetical protein
MFLNKTIEELKSSNLGGTNIVLEQSSLIKKYFELKFKHEREAKEFKANQKVDMQEIYETGLFYACYEKKVNAVYTIVTKLHLEKSAKDQLEEMMYLLLQDFQYPTAKAPYLDNEERLKIYWATKIKAKRDYKAFKDQQKIEQKRIRDELLDNGFIPQILSNAYSNIKLAISNYEQLGSDLEIYRSEAVDQFANSLELVMTEVFLKEVNNVKS